MYIDRRRCFTNEALVRAIEAVKSRAMNRVTAAKAFGIPPSTLCRKVDADGNMKKIPKKKEIIWKIRTIPKS